jgi:hypothetical protein
MISQLLTFLVGMGVTQAPEIRLARNEESRYDNLILLSYTTTLCGESYYG